MVNLVAVTGVSSLLNTSTRLIRKYTEFRLHTLDPTKLQTPAWFTTLAFKLTDPGGSVTTYWDLLPRLWDRQFVTNHATTANYLNNMLMYPAGVVQGMLIKVSIDNSLSRGEIKTGDQVSRFNRIHSALLVCAGERDTLVPPPVAKGIIDLVASRDKAFRIALGGHMGVILCSKALGHVWALTANVGGGTGIGNWSRPEIQT